MTIREQLADELKDAMRAKDAPRRDVIRQIESEVSVAKSEPGFEGEVSDDLYEAVISRYVKKMDKSREEYAGLGERGEAMAEKLAFEVEYLRRWLPSKLSEEETRSLVAETIESLGVSRDETSAGRVIGTLMKDRGSDLDGGLVNRIVREELAGD